jgi:radical SAM superfamily enzyme YgiQ (UPF0313 family)
MKIAFVYPPFHHKKFEEDLDIVSQEFGLFPPLGIAYAAAIHERSGGEARIIDANALCLSKKQVLADLEQWRPDMIAFLLTAYSFFDTLAWIKYLKENTQLPILVGNVLCAMYPNAVMSHAAIDYMLIGPATKTLPELTRRITKNESLDGLPGVGWRKNGQVVITMPETFREDFDDLPFPARHLLPNHKYHAVMSKRTPYTIMVTSKGCNAQCTFCHIHEIPYSAQTPERTVAEIEECVTKHGIREMDIFDPSFTMDRRRVMAICHLIIQKGFDIHWACRARVDQVDEELLQAMAKAGCKRILYGIEHGEKEKLDMMKKGVAQDRIQTVIDLTKKAGIIPIGFFMLGVPGETVQSMKKTLRYARKLNLGYAQFHRTVGKPKTALAKHVTSHLGYDYWEEYIRGNVLEQRMPSPWTSLSDETIQQFTKYAYWAYYFRPHYLLKLIVGIKSFDEFKRYVRSAWGLIFSRKDK